MQELAPAKVRSRQSIRPDLLWRSRSNVESQPALRRAISTEWYSRFVGAMKVVLPSLAVLLVVLVAVWPYLEPDDTRFRIGYSKLSMMETGDPSAVNPRFLGTDDKNQIYSVTADLAKNLVQDATMIDLEMPKADILLEDGTWLVVTADAGVVNRPKETLDLIDKVTVYHDKGYEFTTERATVHLSDRSVTSTHPVQGQGPFGRTQSEGIQVIDKGEVVVFTGRSKVTLYPSAGAALK
jgi:lipopolysaccharide export system protein LptC